jgi:transcriptional regulator GlxA family with amidase domain
VSAPRKRIGLLVFAQFDLLDSGGPYEVFLTANRLAERSGEPSPFEVVTVGAGDVPILAYGGLGITPDEMITESDAESFDVVIVPGTIDVEAVLADDSTVAAVRALAASAEIVASVCTGAFLLAEVGLLDNEPFTTHWEDLEDLSRRVSGGSPVADVRWVDAGRVVTGGGLSSGIHMALHLIDRLVGRELAVATARQICQEWDPDDPSAS